MHTAVPVGLMREFLRDDAPRRELSVARGLALVLGLGFVAQLVQSPFLSAAVAVPGLILLGLYVAYYAAMAGMLKRGMWHPAVPWLNVCLEVFFPIPFLIMQASQKGAEYALSASIHMAWGALLALTAIRMRRSLCVAAGAVAAVSYLAMYVFYMRPLLGPDPMVTFSIIGVSMRAFMLFITGVVAALLADQLVRKAEFALSQVRARDLMGKYFLHEQLGKGGMAEVYRATYSPEGGFEKTVAVKRVLPALSQDPNFIELFRQEAHLVSRLAHPNVVQVHDIGRFDGQYILAMEFVDGVPLSTLIRGTRARLPHAAVAFVAHQLAAALHYIHARTDENGQPLGIIHHDVNPPNILLGRLGEAKLSDFGVARAAARQPHDPDVIRGKINYMAPEQIMGQPTDGRVDLYTLGLTLHEALTGRRVHTLSAREAPVNLMVRMVDQPVPRLADVAPDVPAQLADIVSRLLERNPDDRFPDGAAVCAALEALPPSCNPFPAGQKALAQAVQDAQARPRGAPEPMQDEETFKSGGELTSLDSVPPARNSNA